MEIPPELFARLAHPTVRLSGSIDEATAASFLSQVLPVLEVPSSIVVELFSSGGAVEVGRRVAQEVRILRQAHGRDMWFLGKTLVASAAVTIMAGFPRDLIVVPQLVMLVEPFFHLAVILLQQVQRPRRELGAFFLSFYLRPAGGSTSVPEFGPHLSSLLKPTLRTRRMPRGWQTEH